MAGSSAVAIVPANELLLLPYQVHAGSFLTQSTGFFINYTLTMVGKEAKPLFCTYLVS